MTSAAPLSNPTLESARTSRVLHVVPLISPDVPNSAELRVSGEKFACPGAFS